MPIRGRARDVGTSNIACPPNAILQHKRLFEILRQLSTRHPGHNISNTASAKPYYDGDCLNWPIRLLRISQRGEGKSSNQSKDAAMEPAERGVIPTTMGGSHLCSKGWRHVSLQCPFGYTCGPRSRSGALTARLHTRPLSPVKNPSLLIRQLGF